jgi:hypothetical protein
VRGKKQHSVRLEAINPGGTQHTEKEKKERKEPQMNTDEHRYLCQSVFICGSIFFVSSSSSP